MMVFAGPVAHKEMQQRISVELRKISILFVASITGLVLLFILLDVSKVISFGNILFASSSGKENEGSIGMVNSTQGTGSAFLISNNQWVTAHHVVSDLDQDEGCEILLDRIQPNINLDLRVKKSNESLDIALLEELNQRDARSLIPFSLGSFGDVQVGDEVTIIGYPSGLYCLAKTQVSNDKIPGYSHKFLMSGAAWPGSSGGPIIHSKTGKVIGVLVEGYEGDYKGMVLGVKIDYLSTVLN